MLSYIARGVVNAQRASAFNNARSFGDMDWCRMSGGGDSFAHRGCFRCGTGAWHGRSCASFHAGRIGESARKMVACCAPFPAAWDIDWCRAVYRVFSQDERGAWALAHQGDAGAATRCAYLIRHGALGMSTGQAIWWS